YPITGLGFNWDIRRWDGLCTYREDMSTNPRGDLPMQVWENEAGLIVGLAHADGPGEQFLDLHPDYRAIEEEMLLWAEANLSAPVNVDGTARNESQFFAWEYDAPRRVLLQRHGYEKMPYGGVIRRMRFGKRRLPDPVIADGYTMRTTRPDEGDFQRVADVLNASFGRTFHNAAEYRNFVRYSPSYRHDLDLVAVAPDGTFAALVSMIYDEQNRRGLFEPVCTHPDHRRLGLAQALMREGARRLKALGAFEVTVDTGDMEPANALYDAVGFTEAYKGYYWRKVR
ncbi:MAG: GNAT family N-acetyltransferase, partial [Anaerolineae bacterium]|nr:GNAT family N-acetyltransferase [Anaerolineae bacterium]